MSRLHSSTAIAALAALLCLASPFVSAQERASTLRLTVDPSKTTLILGEPVYATLTLTNTGSQPVSILSDLHLESGFALARARSLSALGRNAEAQSAIGTARELTTGQRALQDVLQQNLTSEDAALPRQP